MNFETLRHKIMRWALVAILCMGFVSAHAAMRVQILAEPLEARVWDIVRLSIVTFLSGTTEPVGVLEVADMPGMQSFEIVSSWQSVQTQSVVVDGEQVTEQATVFAYGMRAIEPWVYTIWPIEVQTNEGIVTSNDVALSVLPVMEFTGPKHDARYLIGVFIGAGIILMILAALVRSFTLKKSVPLRTFSKKEMFDRASKCSDPDSMFYLLQDILAHDHGDEVRSYTIDEMREISQDHALDTLLDLLQKHRFHDNSDQDMSDLHRAFDAYITTHDT